MMIEYPESDVQSASLKDEFGKWKRAGLAMQKVKAAKWNNITPDNLLRHGEAMLEEQKEADNKRRIVIAMTREGPDSSTRKAICNNIQHRLKQSHDVAKESKASLDAHYACMSIRKSLNYMANSRRDLHAVKEHAIKAVGEDDKDNFAEKFSFMRRDPPAALDASGKSERLL